LVRGIYIAASGMELQEARQEAVAQNVANAETPGYKKQRVPSRPLGEFQAYLVEALGEAPLGEVTLGARPGGTVTDFSPGTLRRTGEPLHAAIQGKGFFAVQAEGGEVFYTRDGSFGLDAEGYLVLWGVSGATEKIRVLGRGGQPLRLPLGTREAHLTPDGRLVSEGKEVGEIRVVEFSEEELRALVRRGKNLFSASSEGEVVDPRLRPGYLELSNVDPAGEMVEMMALSRAYEACQRAILAQDALLEKAANEIGRWS
jgi:flagellar basal-body rod protein FlgG